MLQQRRVSTAAATVSCLISCCNSGVPQQLLQQRRASTTAATQLMRQQLLEQMRASTAKGKAFYGQEPPSRESTTTECGVNYQLLAVMY